MKKFIVIFLILIFSQVKAAAQDTIKIAFAIDKNYPVFTMIAIDSILLNNKSNSDYKFYILESNVSKFDKFQIRRFVEKRNQKVEFINVDADSVDDKAYFKNNSSPLKHISNITVMKLKLADVLKNENKVLYLDGDIIVTTDLKKLWDTDLGEYPAGMVTDTYKYVMRFAKTPPKEYMHIKGKYYFNAGVILMNLDKMRKDNLSEKMVEEFKNHPEYLFHDQDVINFVLQDNIMVLPEKWNMQVDTYWPLGKLVPKKGIYHYIGKWKPWLFYPKTYMIVNYPDFQHLYMEYWNKSYLRIYIPYYMIKALPHLYRQYYIETVMLLNSLR